MQVPYGILIALSILLCVFLNDRFENKRCIFTLIFLLPNIAGAFGLHYVPLDQKVGRLICYYLTGPYNAAFVLVLSMQIANTAGGLFSFSLAFLLNFFVVVSSYHVNDFGCSEIAGRILMRVVQGIPRKS